MPKRAVAPKKGARTSRSTGVKKGPAKPRAVEPLDEAPEDEMEAAPKRRARPTAAPTKRAVARKPAPEPMDMDDDMDGREPDLDDVVEAPARRSASPRSKSGDTKLVALLNQSLGWELRAQAMYAHYAAYVKGLESLSLAEHFEGEVTESLGHAKKVRDIIAALGGEALSTRDAEEIVHTEDTRVMLEEALKTESAAAAAYRKIIPLVKDHPVFYHAIYHILRDEAAAVIEVETLLGR